MKSDKFSDEERAEWQHEDLASVKIRGYLGHKNLVSSIHFCSNSTKIFSSSFDETCKIWNISSGEVLQTYSGHKSLLSCADLNQKESQFLTCGWDFGVMIWDLETGQNQLSIKFGGIVTCGKFSDTGDLLIAGTDLDNLVTIVDLKSGKKIKSVKGLHTSTPTSTQFITSDSRILTTGMDRSCKIFDLRTDSITIKLEDHSNIVSSADISLNEHLIVTGSWDKSLLLYDINCGTYRSNGPIKLVNGHEGCVSCCSFSKDATLIVSGGYDSNLVIWDIANQNKELKLQGHTDWVEDVKISDDNQWVLSCSKDHTIRLWNMEQTNKFQTSTVTFVKGSKAAQKLENSEELELLRWIQCLKCGKTYKGTNNGICVFCRLSSDSNASMDIVKEKFSFIL